MSAALVQRIWRATGRVYFYCTGCGCNYFAPTTHEPGSEDCHAARDERDWSRGE